MDSSEVPGSKEGEGRTQVVAFTTVAKLPPTVPAQ